MHNDNKKSKFLNNPVRTIVIEDDNRPGSYPAHIPPGSTLVDPIYFDDTDTIETPTDRSFANSDTFKVSSQVDQLNEVEILFTNATLPHKSQYIYQIRPLFYHLSPPAFPEPSRESFPCKDTL